MDIAVGILVIIVLFLKGYCMFEYFHSKFGGGVLFNIIHVHS